MAKANTQSSKSTTGSSTTPSAESAGAAATSTPKKNHQMMNISVSKAREPVKATLQSIADKLGCKLNDLIWAGVEMLIANPPNTAPEGSVRSVGTAAGFWTLPVFPPKGGRPTSINVVHTLARGSVQGGRTFFRYDLEDAKSKERAKNQAIRAAQYDCKIAGLDPASIQVTEAASA